MYTEEDFRKLLNNMGEEERQETLKLSGLSRVMVNESRLEAAFIQLLKIRLGADALEGLEREIEGIIPSRKFRFDFGYPSRKLLIELQGVRSEGGASKHLRPKGYAIDREKVALAQLQGYTVLEFTPEMLQNGVAWNLLAIALEELPKQHTTDNNETL